MHCTQLLCRGKKWTLPWCVNIFLKWGALTRTVWPRVANTFWSWTPPRYRACNPEQFTMLAVDPSSSAASWICRKVCLRTLPPRAVNSDKSHFRYTGVLIHTVYRKGRRYGIDQRPMYLTTHRPAYLDSATLPLVWECPTTAVPGKSCSAITLY